MKIFKTMPFITIGLYDILAICWFIIAKIKQGINMEWIWENVEEILLIIGVILTSFVWIRHYFLQIKKNQQVSTSKIDSNQKALISKIENNRIELQDEINKLKDFKSRLKGKWKDKFDEKLTF